jgi:hypothetical protein
MSEPVHTSETPATVVAENPADTNNHGGSLTTSPQQDQPDETEQLGEAGKRAIDRMKAERDDARRQAKANADAAKRLKEIEDRDLSELQKAQRDREEALTRLQAIEQEAVRNRVALAKGLPADIAATLSGANEDELAAHADRLIAWRSGQTPPTPRPDTSQGPRPTTPELEADQDYYRFFPDEAPRRA